MAEKRQKFRFRLPWSAAAATARPNQATQPPSSPESPSQPARPAQQAAPAQRPPFHPVGLTTPSTEQLKARAGTPPASPSPTRKETPSRATSRSAQQHQMAPPTKGPRASPLLSPSPGVSQPAKSINPATELPTAPRSASLEMKQESNSVSTPKKQPTTTDITKPQKDQREEETSLPPQKPQLTYTKATETEEVIDKWKGKNELLASEESLVSVPKSVSRQESRNGDYKASSKGRKEKLKTMNYEQQEKKIVTDDKAHSVGVFNELDQHPREEAFDRKEILKIFGSNKHGTKSVHFCQEKESIREKAPLDNEIKEYLPKSIHKLGTRRDKHAWNEKPFHIITLTGENTGATMQLSTESVSRERAIHIQRGYKAKPDGSVDTVTNSDGSTRGRKPANPKVKKGPGKSVCINNNTQGINNSLVFSSSVNERNPGADVVLIQKAAEFVNLGKEVDSHETHKADVSTIPATTLAYTPNIRRRCLKGLFLESNDSDSENLEKPQRHGSRAVRS